MLETLAGIWLLLLAGISTLDGWEVESWERIRGDVRFLVIAVSALLGLLLLLS